MWCHLHTAPGNGHTHSSAFCCEFQRAVKKKKMQTASQANSLSMMLSIYLFRRKKNPSSSLLLLLAVFNSGGFLIDRFWLSGRQHAREKEREVREGWGKKKNRSQQYWKNKNGAEAEFKGRETNKHNGRERSRKRGERERETANPRKVQHLFEAALNSSVTLQIIRTHT